MKNCRNIIAARRVRTDGERVRLWVMKSTPESAREYRRTSGG
jgi:hypothetical protein